MILSFKINTTLIIIVLTYLVLSTRIRPNFMFTLLMDWERLVCPDLESSAVENDEEHGHDDHHAWHGGHQHQHQGRVLWKYIE